MSWSLIRSPLPCRGWTILAPDGEMILVPMRERDAAERMAAENVRGTLSKALRLGYRIVEVEIREVGE